MLDRTHLKDVSLHAVHTAARRTTETLKEIPRVVISAEERLRQKVRSAVRVALATTFFFISALISIGANVTIAFAKKVSPDGSRTKKPRELVRTKRASSHRARLKYRPDHASRLHLKYHASAPSYKAVGTASWYGGKFHNRKTASGVRFNTHSMMAAHRTLPFGTKVRVTNLKNNKCCVVEITDRGPYSHNRLIDLSQAAANALDFASAGIANVRVEVLDGNIGGPDIAALSVPLPVFDVLRLFPGVTSKSKLHATLEKTRAIEHDDELENQGDD